MGACLDYRSYPDAPRKEITAEWNAAVEESLFDGGHSYSGEIGMLIGDIQWIEEIQLGFAEAEDYLQDNHEKWEPAMAVPYWYDFNVKHWLIGGWCSS